MSATILPFRRPAPKLDPDDDCVVCLVERNGRKIAPEVVYAGNLAGCFLEMHQRTIHHVTGTLYRIMPAREVRNHG